jgi:hypothetical protein
VNGANPRAKRPTESFDDSDVVCPFSAPRDEVPLATHVRSTVLLASQKGLRERGLFDAYLREVPAAQRDTLLSVTAGHWLPVELAITHYEACDRLALDRKVIESIGAESGRVINETVISVVVKLSREAGVSPWAALPHGGKMTARTWQGSSVAVFRMGPKEARVEWIAQPAAVIPYFRIAYGAFVLGVVSLFARTTFVRELPQLCTATTLGYRVSWV